jgi:hypothetical protein
MHLVVVPGHTGISWREVLVLLFSVSSDLRWGSANGGALCVCLRFNIPINGWIDGWLASPQVACSSEDSQVIPSSRTHGPAPTGTWSVWVEFMIKVGCEVQGSLERLPLKAESIVPYCEKLCTLAPCNMV